MKTILAATDFSPAAHNAVVYAASLAKLFNARLVLYNAYQPIASPAIEAPVFISLQELKDIADQELAKEASANIFLSPRHYLQFFTKLTF